MADVAELLEDIERIAEDLRDEACCPLVKDDSQKCLAVETAYDAAEKLERLVTRARLGIGSRP